MSLLQLFHPSYPSLGLTYTTAEDALSASMEAYWVGLAANGTVGSGWAGGPALAWSPYALPGRTYNRAACDFWDSQIGFGTY